MVPVSKEDIGIFSVCSIAEYVGRQSKAGCQLKKIFQINKHNMDFKNCSFTVAILMRTGHDPR